MAFDRLERAVALFRGGFTVWVSWYSPNGLALDQSVLAITEWKGRPNFGSHHYARTSEPRELARREFDFEVFRDEQAWRERGSAKLFSAEKLADQTVTSLLERARSRFSTESEAVGSTVHGSSRDRGYRATWGTVPCARIYAP
jgi:hypothetical protein